MSRVREYLNYFYFTIPKKDENGAYIMRLGDEEFEVSERKALLIRKYAMLFMFLIFMGLGALPTENANFPLEVVGTLLAAGAFCLFIRFLAKR